MKFRHVISILAILVVSVKLATAQTKTIHVFVALCDNENQGIVPVPAAIGNGQDPAFNLYWGAGYGVKTFFTKKTTEWKLIKTLKSTNAMVLDQLLFKHATRDVYLLAEAYDGRFIQNCIHDFLQASNGQNPLMISHEGKSISFGGKSDLVCYVGHDGLMDFDVDVEYQSAPNPKKDVMILACYSKSYFSGEVAKTGANPLLWTTHLMAPEAYTLKAAIDGWIIQESGAQIEERAAQAYNQYQKCGIKGARNLFTTGF